MRRVRLCDIHAWSGAVGDGRAIRAVVGSNPAGSLSEITFGDDVVTLDVSAAAVS